MNRYSIAFLLAAMIIAFSSCQNPEQKARLEKIDSLDTKLDSIETAINSLDSAKVAKRFNRVQENAGRLDSVTSGEADSALMAANEKTEETFRRYLSNIERLKQELSYSYEQLDSLRFDVENELLTQNDFKNYFDDESSAVNYLKDKSFYIVNTTKRKMNSFDSLQTEVERYIKEQAYKNEK